VSVRWLGALWMIVALCVAGGARAQSAAHARVQDELTQTDHRIETAQSLVSENPSAHAQTELDTARQLQARAWTAYGSTQLMIALAATRDARAHADRAVAIVRGLPDPDRVQAQVERTQDVLDRARDRLDACDNDRARALLRVAMDMQQRADNALSDSRYLAALQLTMSARERVLKAMRLCSLDETLADTAARALQRTDDVLARATEAADGAPAMVREQLARAQSIQSQGQAELGQGHDEAALRLTLGARVIAQRILQFADIVGRDRVFAGTDCGFGTFAGVGKMDAEISWRKLAALLLFMATF